MKKYLKNNKFEAVKYRHQDQSQLLQLMSQLDIKIFISFMTIQLIFGGFISQYRIDDFYSKFGLLMIGLVIAFVSWKFFYNHYRRRKEVVETIKNCNEALGYNQKGTYLEDKSINSDTKFRPWFHWYSVGIAVSVIGIIIIFFISKIEKIGNDNNRLIIKLMTEKDTIIDFKK